MLFPEFASVRQVFVDSIQPAEIQTRIDKIHQLYARHLPNPRQRHKPELAHANSCVVQVDLPILSHLLFQRIKSPTQTSRDTLPLPRDPVAKG